MKKRSNVSETFGSYIRALRFKNNTNRDYHLENLLKRCFKLFYVNIMRGADMYKRNLYAQLKVLRKLQHFKDINIILYHEIL